jgi:hypothetical protein
MNIINATNTNKTNKPSAKSNKELYLYGAFAGSIAAFITHPAYVIKVDLQKQRTPIFTRQHLYNGVTYQMSGMALEKMLVFGIYNHIINDFNLDKDNIYHSAASGFACGTCASVMTTVADQFTIANPMKSVSNIKYMDIFRGLPWTFARESIGFAIYFTVFQQLSKYYNKENNIVKTGLIGAATSAIAWSVIYPVDTIKTHIQSHNNNYKYNLRSLYRGFHFSLVRAVPFHTSCFVIFEWLKKEN